MTPGAKLALVLVPALALAPAVACGIVAPLGPRPPLDAPGGTGGGGPGGAGPSCGQPTVACSGTDLRGATCASAVAHGWVGTVACTADGQLDTDDCAPPPTTYAALDDISKWATFDLSNVNPAAHSFLGAVFDGRQYVYLVPWAAEVPLGTVARLDLGLAFETAAAWSTYDVSTTDPAAAGFLGGAFDGTSVYFVPGGMSHFARYDSSGAFDLPSSWTTIDLAAIDAAAIHYVGAAFDGRHVYLAPGTTSTTPRKVARYDACQRCESNGQPPACDLAFYSVPGGGFGGAIFDGTYVYFVPAATRSAMRYDTRATFQASTAWASFDIRTVGVDDGYNGAVFDDRYVYFIPYHHSKVLRLDTGQTFTDTTAWTVFDVAAIDGAGSGYTGGTTDGRYIYLVPYDILPTAPRPSMSDLVRYDTTAEFTDEAAWSVFDVARVNPGAQGFSGAAFDGQYVYLVPNLSPGSVVARFDAKSPRWLPRHWNASFL